MIQSAAVEDLPGKPERTVQQVSFSAREDL